MESSREKVSRRFGRSGHDNKPHCAQDKKNSLDSRGSTVNLIYPISFELSRPPGPPRWPEKHPSRTKLPPSLETSKSPALSLRKSHNVSKTQDSYAPPLLLTRFTLRAIANPSLKASPCHMHESLSPCLSDELYLLAQQPLLRGTDNNNDYEPFVQENSQPDLEPTRLAPSPRLGLTPTANHKPPRFRSSW
jgi:hypothetical protein